MKSIVPKIENPGKTELHVIEMQTGEYLGEDDIVRIDGSKIMTVMNSFVLCLILVCIILGTIGKFSGVNFISYMQETSTK